MNSILSALLMLSPLPSYPGLNRTVVYSLADSASGFFSIDPVSGMVILEKYLDRESRDSYRVRVQATDQAGQQGALSSQVPRDPDSNLAVSLSHTQKQLMI